ncbi:uncharacterized protein LOC143154858 [Ptiloglossa arizonensis]|uniref:uncharacterized protein LOC143154858 n=1 Tax=Ptiloglossa arizonensis TaxID=3350558 RepID=UPI003FA0CAE8
MAVVRIYAGRVRPKLMVKINVDIGTSDLWIRERNAERRLQAPSRPTRAEVCRTPLASLVDSPDPLEVRRGGGNGRERPPKGEGEALNGREGKGEEGEKSKRNGGRKERRRDQERRPRNKKAACLLACLPAACLLASHPKFPSRAFHDRDNVYQSGRVIEWPLGDSVKYARRHPVDEHLPTWNI